MPNKHRMSYTKKRWGVCSFHSCVPTGGSLLHSRGTWPSCLPISRLPGGWLHWLTGARFSPYLGFWWATQSEDPPIPLFLQGPLRPFPPPKCFCWNAPTWIFCHWCKLHAFKTGRFNTFLVKGMMPSPIEHLLRARQWARYFVCSS